MIVIGLSGYSASGKDSVADILVRDYGFTKMAFATPLKEMVKRLDPVVGYDAGGYYCDCECCATAFTPIYLHELYDDGYSHEDIKKSEHGTEVRRLWERFGTEVMRDYHEDFWVHRAADDLLNCHLERIVFTDVRFENEAEFIFELGENPVFDQTENEPRVSTLWRVARPGVRGGGWGDHAAEQLAGLLGEEVTILNDGSLEALQEPVATAMGMLLNKAYPGQQAFEIEGVK